MGKNKNKITKNKKQFALEYNVNTKTFDKMLAPLMEELLKLSRNAKGLKVFNPRQIKFIYEELGNPNADV